MNEHIQQLKAEITAQNAANSEANRRFILARDIATKFWTKKILKTSGAILTERFRKAMEPVLRDDYGQGWARGCCVRCHHEPRTYFLMFEVTVAWNTATQDTPGNRVVYRRANFRVGTIQGGVLESVDNASPDLRADWTYDEVVAKREAVATARAALRDAEQAISPFLVENS